MPRRLRPVLRPGQVSAAGERTWRAEAGWVGGAESGRARSVLEAGSPPSANHVAGSSYSPPSSRPALATASLVNSKATGACVHLRSSSSPHFRCAGESWVYTAAKEKLCACAGAPSFFFWDEDSQTCRCVSGSKSDLLHLKG